MATTKVPGCWAWDSKPDSSLGTLVAPVAPVAPMAPASAPESWNCVEGMVDAESLQPSTYFFPKIQLLNPCWRLN